MRGPSTHSSNGPVGPTGPGVLGGCAGDALRPAGRRGGTGVRPNARGTNCVAPGRVRNMATKTWRMLAA
eukprot:5524694-Lingulodinium_polyedra.AAC.1